MNISIADIKAHVLNFLLEKRVAIDTALHLELQAFAVFLEGKQAEADAVTLLTSKGYVVSHGPVTDPQPPVISLAVGA